MEYSMIVTAGRHEHATGTGSDVIQKKRCKSLCWFDVSPASPTMDHYEDKKKINIPVRELCVNRAYKYSTATWRMRGSFAANL